MGMPSPASHPPAPPDPPDPPVAAADLPLDVRWQVRFDGATRGSWEQLLAADPTSSPFVSPAWVDAWMRHCGRAATLALVSVWCSGELVGVAPLMEITLHGTRFLTGAAQRDSDHWDVVARPDVRHAVVHAIVREIQRRRDRWDVVRLDHLPVHSLVEWELRESGLRVASVSTSPCPMLPLPDTFDKYLLSIPKKRRQSVRRSLKRLDDGEVSIRPVHEPSDLERTLTEWQALRVEQYRHRRGKINRIHVTESYRGFLVAALSEMTVGGAALAWSVERAGKVVGVYITLRDDRAAYAYQGGYDVCVSNLGIGKIVNALLVQRAISDGKRALDFGRGREAYKYWYGAHDRDMVALMCGHEGARSTLAYASHVLWLKSRETIGDCLRRVRRPGSEG
jgi:CelD/BcsL family acetyltransferase involved in cellulose biosynthesis